MLDEMPYLIATDPGFEGTLQKVFDRELSRRPVLLICVGSDLAMMEALNDYGRPFHQRATEMVVPPLSPGDVGEMLQLPSVDAIDAYLVTGGLPLVLDDWAPGETVGDYLAKAVPDPTSALIVSGERAFAAEFPPQSQPGVVLRAIGSGERTASSIARAAGGIPQASLHRALRLLADKRIVEATLPLSTRPSRETRYVVADPYLRFWLAFLDPYLAEIERGRGDLTLARIHSSWTSWRGRAVEPVIRESLRRLPPGHLPFEMRWWAGTGRVSTIPRSTWSAVTVARWPSGSRSWARSSGWRTARSTVTTWPGCFTTAPSYRAPTTRRRSSRWCAVAARLTVSRRSGRPNCSPRGGIELLPFPGRTSGRGCGAAVPPHRCRAAGGLPCELVSSRRIPSTRSWARCRYRHR
ncbi:hypothetical protein ABZ647_24025 [Micromonospora aurantiaca]|uniref:ATP-binding protein n=1 Tax=Micromonospora aurantiaca (nom. illeg.) TaxID=47850 RepID=UPI0033EECB21